MCIMKCKVKYHKRGIALKKHQILGNLAYNYIRHNSLNCSQTRSMICPKQFFWQTSRPDLPFAFFEKVPHIFW